MSADDDRVLDPDRLATRGFSSSFRGFDQQEVRAFLEELAAAVRNQKNETFGLNTIAPKLEAVTKERDDLAVRLGELEERFEAKVAELTTVNAALEEAAAAEVGAARSSLHVTEFDEAAMTDMLGKETVRVLDTAREAARGITAKSQAEAERRATEMADRESAVAADLEKRRTEFEEAAALLRQSSEDEAKRLTDEASESAEKVRSGAAKEADAVGKAAADEAAALRLAAQEETDRLRREADVEVSALRSEAEDAANSLRATAEADASTAQDDAREHARQMLNEAQAVREKVLADLVKRRRIGRQQLDQVKAARDRLARSLAVVRKDLDEAMSELVAAVPDARAAMEAVGRRVPEFNDARQAVELGAELDTARVAGIPIPGMSDDDVGEPLPDIDELFARIKTGETLDGSDEGDDQPASADDASTSDDAPEKDAETGSSKAATGSTTKKSARKKPTANEPAPEELNTEEPTADELNTELEGPEAAAESAASHGATDDEDESVASALDLPRAFADRDVAMTRYGADLRRQMKRALADDQSQILDALRRAKKIGFKDLPDVAAQREGYVASARSALENAANDGASSAGGSCSDELVGELIEAIAGELIEPLRQKVERVVAAADGDREDALEPIRALYREARGTQLPDLADDALAQAFALGYYDALPDGTSIAWLGDPRLEAGPDCFDNTLAGSVTKPDVFPTGHHLPPGSPGCRCLVVAALAGDS